MVAAARARHQIHAPAPAAQRVEIGADAGHVHGVQNRGVHGGDKRNAAAHGEQRRGEDRPHQAVFTLVRGRLALAAPALHAPVVQGEEKIQPAALAGADHTAMRLEIEDVREPLSD